MKFAHLFEDAKNNQNFLMMLYTGKHSQLALMNLKPGEDVLWGSTKTDKIFLVIEGSGEAVVGEDERPIGEGDVVFVTAGLKHDLVNTGESELKMAIILAPAIYSEDASHGTREKATLDPFTDLDGVE